MTWKECDGVAWKEELMEMMKAKTSVIYIRTDDEYKVLDFISDVCKGIESKLYRWTAVSGMQELKDGFSILEELRNRDVDTMDPTNAILQIFQSECGHHGSVYVLHDLHNFFDNPRLLRALREMVFHTKETLKTVILISPVTVIPRDLATSIGIIDIDRFSPWSVSEMRRVLDTIIDSVTRLNKHKELKVNLSDVEKEDVIKVLSGLTTEQAENLIAMSIVTKKAIDVSYIRSKRKKMVTWAQME